MREKRYYQIGELAERWGVTRKTIRHYIRKGYLKAEREREGTGYPHRVHRREVERFEEEVRPKLRPGRYSKAQEPPKRRR